MHELYYSISKFLLQKLLTTLVTPSNSLHDESFDLHLQPLTKTWYFSSYEKFNYSLSGFTAILERNPNLFLLNTFLPTGLLTITSFIGFLIPVDMIPGRTALLVTIFLMIVNIRSAEQKSGPKVCLPTFFVILDIVLLNCNSYFFRQEKLLLWTSGYYFA